MLPPDQPSGDPGPEYVTVPERTIRDQSAARRDDRSARIARLVVIAGADLGRIHPLAGARVVIGRSSKSGIQLDEEAVSRAHAEIERLGSALVVRDLGSTNGTFVNEQRLTADRRLGDGDRLRIGRTTFKFLADGNAEGAYHEEIYRLRTTDPLTQVGNRAHLQQQLERELARVRREQRELSFILLDLDRFKQINDTYGHPAGDHVLRSVAATLRLRVRAQDTLARYGGEEFAIILPDTGARDAAEFAETLRRLVESTAVTHAGVPVPVTISLGVATVVAGDTEPSSLVKRADERLYAAKRAGRNRVCGEP